MLFLGCILVRRFEGPEAEARNRNPEERVNHVTCHAKVFRRENSAFYCCTYTLSTCRARHRGHDYIAKGAIFTPICPLDKRRKPAERRRLQNSCAMRETKSGGDRQYRESKSGFLWRTSSIMPRRTLRTRTKQIFHLMYLYRIMAFYRLQLVILSLFQRNNPSSYCWV